MSNSKRIRLTCDRKINSQSNGTNFIGNMVNPLNNDPYYQLIIQYLSPLEIKCQLSMLSKWHYDYLSLSNMSPQCRRWLETSISHSVLIKLPHWVEYTTETIHEIDLHALDDDEAEHLMAQMLHVLKQSYVLAQWLGLNVKFCSKQISVYQFIELSYSIILQYHEKYDVDLENERINLITYYFNIKSYYGVANILHILNNTYFNNPSCKHACFWILEHLITNTFDKHKNQIKEYISSNYNIVNENQNNDNSPNNHIIELSQPINGTPNIFSAHDNGELLDMQAKYVCQVNENEIDSDCLLLLRQAIIYQFRYLSKRNNIEKIATFIADLLSSLNTSMSLRKYSENWNDENDDTNESKACCIVFGSQFMVDIVVECLEMQLNVLYTQLMNGINNDNDICLYQNRTHQHYTRSIAKQLYLLNRYLRVYFETIYHITEKILSFYQFFVTLQHTEKTVKENMNLNFDQLTKLCVANCGKVLSLCTYKDQLDSNGYNSDTLLLFINIIKHKRNMEHLSKNYLPMLALYLPKIILDSLDTL